MSAKTDLEYLAGYARKMLDVELDGLKVPADERNALYAVATMSARAALRAAKGESAKETCGIAVFSLAAAAGVNQRRAQKAAKSWLAKVGAKALELILPVAEAAAKTAILKLLDRLGVRS